MEVAQVKGISGVGLSRVSVHIWSRRYGVRAVIGQLASTRAWRVRAAHVLGRGAWLDFARAHGEQIALCFGPGGSRPPRRGAATGQGESPRGPQSASRLACDRIAAGAVLSVLASRISGPVARQVV